VAFFQSLKTKFSDQWETGGFAGSLSKGITGVVLVVALASLVLGFYWDTEPELFDVQQNTQTIAAERGLSVVTGSATVATMMTMTDILLHKPGGYLTNDILPPSIWMDNVPSWEFGVLVQLRDMARTMRNNLSRSQSQSTEDPSLVRAENQLYFDNDTWVLPETENEYQQGIAALDEYLHRLSDPSQPTAQFYARSDNLRVWLSEVETRLGSLSQRLSASVGKRQLDTSLAGDTAATRSTATDPETEVKTPWLELDDVFYEARGTTWAIILLLKAIEVDFADVLAKKNATVSMQQIIRELEPTQDAVFSPMILNGSGLGILANHSLVMGSHISRSNAALSDLRRLLEEG